ncbi:MAG: GIY-YIG nuclease family protein [Stenotrophomonas sp.]
MVRPTLDEIFAEVDEFGLLAVKAKPLLRADAADKDLAILRDVTTFFDRRGRLPEADANDYEEMRLGAIWKKISENPSEALLAADHTGILTAEQAAPARSWRDEPLATEIPDSLNDIFDDDALDVRADYASLRHITPAAERHVPDHRAEFVPCRDFDKFKEHFETVQRALEASERKALPVLKFAIIEPEEGDVFIRNGLLALIAEKSEMTARSGSRDHRLRVIFSNGTESDPLMSSFRKSLNEDKTARMVERSTLGQLADDWEADRLDLSGTIYVARSLSDDPNIASQRRILHKIGVTSQDVGRRVADARNDPTFLLAPVEIVATFELKNLSRQKVENLLHRFFDSARPGELSIMDRFGRKVHPREWFYVLPEHVSQAATLIREGTLHLYTYDLAAQKIARKL